MILAGMSGWVDSLLEVDLSSAHQELHCQHCCTVMEERSGHGCWEIVQRLYQNRNPDSAGYIHPAIQKTMFKILFSWSQNSFLDSCAERMSNGRWGEPEHRILGLWESWNPILTTSHQRPQSKLPLKDSFQFYSKFVSIFTIFTFHCQTGKGCVCVCQLLRKARGPINQVEQ